MLRCPICIPAPTSHKNTKYKLFAAFLRIAGRYTLRMQVYVELALAENFCMDFVLLFCAKLLCKNACGYRRIALSSALGACFAVLFPLMRLAGVWAVAVKVLSGLALAAACGRFSRFRQYAAFAAVFFALSFALGGAVFAIFSLAGWDVQAGQGYMISSVPVGIPLFLALMLAVACRAVALKIRKRAGGTVHCVLCLGDRQAEADGFFDSGNSVYFGGEPVTIVPAHVAAVLTDVSALSQSVKIHTVTGSSKIKIFTADKIVIYNGEKQHTIKYAKIGISPRPIVRAVLHPDLAADD